VAVRFTCGHFNRGKRADRGRHPARPHVAANLHDAAVGRRKNHVDRKLHAEGVDGRARCDDEGMVRRKRRAAEEAARARGRIKRSFHHAGHGRTGAPSHVKHPGAGVAPEQRLQERTHGPRS